MSESNESYYEIALTHREVLVAFVAILACVLGAFLGGVWLGRRGADELLAQERLAGAPAAEASQEEENGEDVAKLEEFRFFSDEEDSAAGQDEGLSKPDLSKLLDDPNPDTTLAQDVGSAPRARGAKTEEERRAAQERRRRRQVDKPPSPEGQAARQTRQKPPRQERGEPAEPPEERPAAPPPPPPPTPPPPTTTVAAPPPPAPPAAAQEGFVIQVFSTHDQPQARKVLNQLQGSGFLAFMSPVEVDGATMYRVRIGPFEDKDQAEASAAQVRQKFKLDTWVTAASN